MNKYIVGIDIGGTKTAVVIAPNNQHPEDSKNIIIDRIEFSTPIGLQAESSISKIIDTIDTILINNRITRSQLKVIGISCGGPVDSYRGLILSPPNLYGWNNIPIVELLSIEFKTTVRLQNDANACALAEWKFGAGIGTQNMIFLTMGTGMGAGLILNGRLYSGTNGMAGEIGHIRLSENGPVGYGKEGSFEGFCSGGGIAQIARTKAQERLQVGENVGYCKNINEINDITAKKVSDFAEVGDIAAIETYRKSGKYLGKGISILIDLLNPELIVVGSIFYRSSNLLWESAYEVIKKETLAMNRSVCKVVSSKLGNNVGDYGAITVAMYDEDKE